MSPAFVTLLILAYLMGALPWSVWLGRRFYGVDPRSLGDGNPGAANAFRAGGWRLGIGVLLLDFLKAFLPVGVASWILRLPDSQHFWIALAPTLGHAFSIFLGFRGGRALVTVFGVWCGLTLYEAPLVMGGTALILTRLLKRDEISTLLIPVVLLIYLLLRGYPAWLLLLAGAQAIIFALKIGVAPRWPRPISNDQQPT